MNIVIEELGQTIIAILCGGHIIGIFMEILEVVTSF